MLLSALSDKVLSATELMKNLELSHRPCFRKKYLIPAIQSGLIEMTVPDKSNRKNQEYKKCK